MKTIFWPSCLVLTEFVVNGKGIPEVDFDIGESYAGLLPVSPQVNSSLYFWFFPSSNPKASDEITIWLNGGPGCSSLHGVLQENGPFLWQPGTHRPVPNPYSWSRLTNMLYVDQPAGTGFSRGGGIDGSVTDIAEHFVSWFKNFVDTFDLHGHKVYITGESYAGKMIPYIASRMLDEGDAKYSNVKGVQINDPIINHDVVLYDAPAVGLMNYYQNVLALDPQFVADMNKKADECGYTDFMAKALTYPPSGKLPSISTPADVDCRLRTKIFSAAGAANRCFTPYHITEFCPWTWNQLGDGFPGNAAGPNNFFNRPDVQAAINAPRTEYSVCGGYRWKDGTTDQGVPSGLGPLPGVIERTNNTIIGQGWLDYIVLLNGTLATIQNMTWNGAQGFQRPPVEPLIVPQSYRAANMLGVAEVPAGIPDANTGRVGTAHTERGLTFSSVFLAGHALPQYAPGAAYRQLELLLGRIQSLDKE
ncbi:Carboxypeptidase cpdS [Hirsutella minnesotensis 3608]|uniref:Carboxypeptidase n=1 Tax=Hirsutella minnesotensis 3608 TaxID=1043627 RepID=A0A0F8A299_9HYPO|nr:Carboxypeptidase cpdS [Hirsutella minnesotensis 3608]